MSGYEGVDVDHEISFKRKPLTPSNCIYDLPLLKKPTVQFSVMTETTAEQSRSKTPPFVDDGTETFASPSTALTTNYDFSGLSSQVAQKSELSRKSLYKTFDPFAGSDSPVQASHRVLPETPVGGKLLDLDTPGKPAATAASRMQEDRVGYAGDENDEDKTTVKASILTNKADSSVFTQAQLDEAVAQAIAEAVKNSQDDVVLLQMEIDDLRKKLGDERATNLEMTRVVESYSVTLTQMLAAQEAQKGEGSEQVKELHTQITTLKHEKAQAESDLNKTEVAFSDLHRKYEKLKEVLENYRQNEAKLKTAFEQRTVALQQADERYETLKSHAEKKLEAANAEIVNAREQLKAQLSAQTAKLKQTELKMVQLERQLEIREKDNAELTGICDDLVRQLEAAGKQ